MNFFVRFDLGLVASRVALVSLAVSTVVLLVAAVASGLNRRRAATRHALWLCALVWVVLSPVVAVLVDRTGIRLWTLPLAKAEPSVVTRMKIESEVAVIGDPAPAFPAPRAFNFAPRDRAVAGARTQAPRIMGSSDGSALAGVLWLFWGSGVAVGLVRLLAGWRRLAGLSCSASRLDPDRYGAALARVGEALELGSVPVVETSALVTGPIAVGLWRPRVILPEGLAGSMSTAELRDVLVHECAHVLRHDTWVGLLQRVAGVLFWPHPLVHYMNGQLIRAREEVCDNHVLGLGDACGYARTLLSLTERCGPAGSYPVGLGLLGSRWTLSDRVAGLLDPGRVALTSTSTGLKVVVAVALGAPGSLVAMGQLGGMVRAEQAAPGAAVEAELAGVGGRRIRGIVVDERGVPVAGARVRLVQHDQGTTSAGDGTFSLTLDGDFPSLHEELAAEAEGNSRMGVARYDEPQDLRAGPPVRIVLKASRRLAVRVKDGAGAPVPGADVEVFDDDASYRTKARTGADGFARLNTPVDVHHLAWVMAHKAGSGFDYFENYTTWPPREFTPLPEEVTLTLDGAQTIRGTFRDTEDRPLVGLAVAPRSLFKSGKVYQVTPFVGTTAWTVTDAAGVAAFDWMPKSLTRCTFQVRRETLQGQGPPRPASFFKGPPGLVPGPTERTYRFPATTPLSGTVRFPDGRPAPGILIQAQGHINNVNGAPVYARTADNGRYTVSVRPDQVYLLSVLDETWAVASRTTEVARAGLPQEGIDLTLIKGTLLHGRVVDGAGNKPVAGLDVALREDGGELPANLRNMNRDRALQRRWTKTDADGRYHFRVGPGRFALTAAGGSGPVPVEVKAEPEILRDIALKGNPTTSPLRGVVLETTPAGDRPVGGASVILLSAERPGNLGRARANDRGEFALDRPQQEIGAYALDARGYAGFVRLGAVADRVTVVVSPSAELTGRVVDPTGKPYVRRSIHVNFKLDPMNARPVEREFLTRTDDQGRFTIRGATVGSEGEVSASHGVSNLNPVRTAVAFRVRTADPVALPDLVVPQPGPPGPPGSPGYRPD